MVEKSYFYDSTQDDRRVYQAADFADFHNQIIGNGVSNDPNLDNLSVIPKQDLTVSLGTGYAFAEGYAYQNTELLDLTHDIADPNNDRIDLIVIRFDSNSDVRNVSAGIKKGVAASSPIPRTLKRNEGIFELAVAEVRILAGTSTINASQITDTRDNSSLCGYIPLQNIYRGIEIDNKGIVRLPNQSFVSSNDISDLALPRASGSSAEQQIVPLTPQIDKQGEVSNNKFTATVAGVYFFNIFIILRAMGSTLGRFTIFLSVNGDRDSGVGSGIQSIFSQIGISQQSIGLSATGILQLDAEDTVEVVFEATNTGSTSNTGARRVNITKLN